MATNKDSGNAPAINGRAYPVEDHSFDREASWADEYKRILKLFTTTLHPETRTPAAKGGKAGSKKGMRPTT